MHSDWGHRDSCFMIGGLNAGICATRERHRLGHSLAVVVREGAPAADRPGTWFIYRRQAM